TVYGGFDWASEAFAAKMAGARERLALLARPSRSLQPGRYRAYLTPTAMEEIAGMLCWGGFSGRALETRQSCLFRLKDGAAALDPSIAFAENTAEGIAPAFQDEGFARPQAVPVVRFDDGVFRLRGDQRVSLTAERELLVNGDTYRERNVSSMRLPGAVVRDMAFTL